MTVGTEAPPERMRGDIHPRAGAAAPAFDSTGAVKGAALQPVQVRPEELSVHLGSYPGGGEGDRPVEALGTRAHGGGSANVRAVTCVKPEQAPKGVTRAPSRLQNGEGRRDSPSNRPERTGSLAGVLGTARTSALLRTTGDLLRQGVEPTARWGGCGCNRSRRGPR